MTPGTDASRLRLLSTMAVCGLAMGPLVQACRTAGSTPETVPPRIVSENCPLPVLIPAGKPRPRWLRMVNRTSDTLTVFVDRCFWHTRLARVPPGKARRALLPDELIPYDGGLLMHAFTSREHFGSFLTPIRPEPLLEVELTGTGVVDEGRLPHYALEPGEGRAATERTIVTDTVRGYTAVWGIGGSGVLTWACSQGDAHLSVAIGANLPANTKKAKVRHRLDEGEWSQGEGWEVVRSGTDAVVAPRPLMEELTRLLMDAERVSFRVERERPGRRLGYGSTYSFAFDVRNLRPELERLPCLRGLLGLR
jgi:hypothetical protein